MVICITIELINDIAMLNNALPYGIPRLKLVKIPTLQVSLLFTRNKLGLSGLDAVLNRCSNDCVNKSSPASIQCFN